MKTIMFLLTTILTINLHAQVQIDSITWGALDQHETAIAVALLIQSVIATWNDFRSNIQSDPGYAISSDGGLTWFKKGIMDDINQNLTYGFDPSCGFDRYGNVFQAYNAKYGSEPFNRGPVYVSKSIDYGMNWTHIPVNQTDGNDKPYMTVDNTGGSYDGRVYVVWRNQNLDPMVAYLPKNGDAFTGTQTLSGSLFCPMPAVAPNGDVFVVTRANGLFNFYKSTNGGLNFTLTFSKAIEAYPDFIPLGIYKIWANPSYAIDPNTGYQYLAYTNNNPEPYRIVLIQSTNSGQNWDPIPTLQNAIEKQFSGYSVFYPWVSVDPSGKLILSFLSYENGLIKKYYMESYDQGQSWENNSYPQLIDIMGNPSVYYQFHKNDYLGNTTTLFQTTLLYWKHLTNPNQTDIYRAIVKPFYTTSNTLSATAGASNRKIIYSGNKWHRVFISNKQLYYSYSTDDGINWDGYDVVSDTFDLSDISNPSLSVYGDTLHTIFTAEERKIYYACKVGSQNWQTPKLIYTAPQTLFGVTSAVDLLRKGHVTWIEDNGMLLSMQVMKHGTFAVHSVNPAISGISTVQNGYGMINPGMDYDIAGTPHVVWQQNDEVYYKYKTGSSSWSSLLNISNSPSSASAYPAIELVYSLPHVVWQESVGGKDEIYYRYKGSVWSSAVNISQTDDLSKHPSMISTINGPMIVWADHHYVSGVLENSYIRYFIPDLNESGVIEGQSYRVSNHPALGIRPLQSSRNRIIIQWSDQYAEHLNQPPYKIGSQYFEMGVSPLMEKKSLPHEGIPEDFILLPNYPNPFNPATQITFGAPFDCRVILKIYDILGREVKNPY